MNCPRCHGIGRLTYDQLTEGEKAELQPAHGMDGFGSVFPCPPCGGGGIVHCCEGDRADPCEARQ